MKVFGKDKAFEWAGIPCLVWVGVVVLAFNHLVYPFVAEFCPWIKPVDLPPEYWTALGWIICGLFGKKAAVTFAEKKDDNPSDKANASINYINDMGSAFAPDPEDVKDGNGRK
ncbi:MAG: hypothetical protein Q4F74_02765 [Synergistaceae bacterium]|nr:hypothetical protein [Synergistaceae bacterium]